MHETIGSPFDQRQEQFYISQASRSNGEARRFSHILNEVSAFPEEAPVNMAFIWPRPQRNPARPQHEIRVPSGGYGKGRPEAADRFTVEQGDVAELQEQCLALVRAQEHMVVGLQVDLP